MARRILVTFALFLFALAFAGCSSDAPTIGDPGFDLDEWLADNGVVKMVAGADGVEWGTTTSGADGTAKFYSPAHKGIFQLTTVDDQNAITPGLRVSVGATAATASYIVLDDAGKYAPMVFNGPIDGHDQSGTVKTEDLQGAAGDPYVFTPGGNPFSTQFTLLGLEFTISIMTVLEVSITTVAGLVIKDLVENACLFFEPLHHDACAIAGDVVSDLAGFAFAGIPMALEKGIGYAAKDIATSELPKAAAELFCGNVIGKNLIGWTKPRVDGAPETTLETKLRTALYKYNYVLDQLDKSPPQSYTAAQQAELRTAGDALVSLAQKIREGYLSVYNPEEMGTHGLEFGFDATNELVGKLLEGRKVITTIVSLDEVEAVLFHVQTGSSTFVYQAVSSWHMDVPVESFEELLSETKQKVAGTALGCFFGIASEATIDYLKDNVQEHAQEDLETHWGKALDVVDEDLNELYSDLYGAPPPPPTCLPDLWEPNGTWQQGTQQTIAGQLNGSNTVTLKDLDLCGADDDWYAYSAGPISFSAGAAIRKPLNGQNGDKSVCVELYWYSEDYQISGWDPDLVAGPTCGSVDSEPTTPSVNVAGTLGESFRDVLVHVYPDPNNAQSVPRIDYDLEVHP